jgi:hypothetical protein
MHLLFVTSLLPDQHPTTGFEIANRAIVEGYRAAGVRLTLCGFRRPDSPPPAEAHIDLGERQIENAGATKAQKAAWVAKALASGRPVAAAKLMTLSEAALRERLTEAGPVDGIVLNSVQMPAAYPFLTRFAPMAFVAHNVEHASARENARHAASPASRFLYRREAELLRKIEARITAEARVVHVVSKEDGAGLGLEGDPRVLPLPLTVGHERSAKGEPPRDFDVAMIGTWSWQPNRVGMDWFLRDVVPLLPEDVRIGIAGRFDGPPPPAPGNVRFLGRVADAQDFVHSARVVALAARGGTGIQLKTLETLEEGLPAVATSEALRGVGAALPDNLRVADEAPAFAAALLDLVRRDRAGESLRVDGSAFARHQSEERLHALSCGAARLAAAKQAASSTKAPAR